MQESYRGRYEKLKRERRKRRRRFMAVFSFVLIVVAVIFWGIPALSPDTPDEDVVEVFRPDSPVHTSVPTLSIALSEAENTRFLELVNFEHPIRHPPNYDVFVMAYPNVPAQSAGLLLHEQVISAVADWLDAASSANIEDFFVASGYRDIETQRELFRHAENTSLVKPAGHSEHHTGLAVDIAIPGVPLHEMEGLPAVLWLYETAWEHGFIQRYTEGTYHITGILHEPWHFRYVGLPHAYYMWQNDLVLEEYLAHLQNEGVINIVVRGQVFEVWHQIPEDGRIYVPQHLPFTLSSDNMGGYIVTVQIS